MMLGPVHSDIDVDPLNVYYTLDVNETRLATFDSLTGGEIEINVIKHNVVHESGEYQTMLIPGPTQCSPVVLERGFGNTKELYNWFVEASGGKTSTARKNVTITLNALLDGEFTPLVAWNLVNAWPTKLSGFDSNQDGEAKLARFSMTLTAESIERTDP